MAPRSDKHDSFYTCINPNCKMQYEYHHQTNFHLPIFCVKCGVTFYPIETPFLLPPSPLSNSFIHLPESYPPWKNYLLEEPSEPIIPIPAKTIPEPPQLRTFWTACQTCNVQYEHVKIYLDLNLRCRNCKEAFSAKEMAAPRFKLAFAEAIANGSFYISVKGNGTRNVMGVKKEMQPSKGRRVCIGAVLGDSEVRESMKEKRRSYIVRKKEQVKRIEMCD